MLYENNEQVKELIKKLMAEKQMNYEKIAEKLGTSRQNLYKILNKNQLKLDDIKKICQALDQNFYIQIFPSDQKYDIYRELQRLMETQEYLYGLVEKKEKELREYRQVFNDIAMVAEKIEIEKIDTEEEKYKK